MTEVHKESRHSFCKRVTAGLLKGTSGMVAFGAVIAAGPALAQSTDNGASDDTGMIVVTAQRRAELSRDVPITITTLNETVLKEARVDSLASLPKLTPGLRFDKQGAYVQPTIRGIGTTIALTQAGSSVGVYVDGFYVPNTLSLDFQFLNVESVQVLKGPQGTLFGRNATSGAILVKTADPSTETKAIVEASYERFNARRLQGYLTTGLTENIAVSIEGDYSAGDGFVRNVYDGSLLTGGGFNVGARKKHPGKYEKWTVRGALKADLSHNFSVLLRYEHGDTVDPTGVVNGTWVQNGQVLSVADTIPGTVFGIGRRNIALNQRADFGIKTDTVQMTAKLDLDAATLTSYTQYREEEIWQYIDMDFSSASVMALYLPEKARVVTQELLLNSAGSGPFQYTAGLFLFNGKSDTGIGLSFQGSPYYLINGNGAKTETYAAYFDGTYQLTDDLYLTGGLRYSHDAVKDPYFGPQTGKTFSPNYKSDRLSPRIVLRYKPSDQQSIYASFTKGYKSAISDPQRTSALAGAAAYKNGYYLRPEDINAYEVGYKYADRQLSVEVAGFYYDYKNLQNSYYEMGNAFYSNAAASRIKGIEGSVRYDVSSAFQISAAGTYLDAKYRKYEVAGYFAPIFLPDVDGDGVDDFAGYDTSSPADASGFQMQRAPKFSGTLGARYRTEVAGGALVASSNLYHSSRVYFDPAHQFSQKAYSTLSARLQWTDPSEHYTLAIFGDNITDTKYYTQAQTNVIGTGAIWGRPATYGGSVRIAF